MNFANTNLQTSKCIGGNRAMKKKMLAVLLTAAMMASLASGCGKSAQETAEPAASSAAAESTAPAASGDEETTAGETDQITFPLAETKNFSMLCVINGDTPMDEVDAFKYLNEQSNITFEVNSVPQEDAAEKEGLIIQTFSFFPVCQKMTLISTGRKEYSFPWRII